MVVSLVGKTAVPLTAGLFANDTIYISQYSSFAMHFDLRRVAILCVLCAVELSRQSMGDQQCKTPKSSGIK